MFETFLILLVVAIVLGVCSMFVDIPMENHSTRDIRNEYTLTNQKLQRMSDQQNYDFMKQFYK